MMDRMRPRAGLRCQAEMTGMNKHDTRNPNSKTPSGSRPGAGAHPRFGFRAWHSAQPGRALALPFVILAFVFTASAADDYFADWDSCRYVYLNTASSGGAAVDDSVPDFPVLVRLTSSNWPANDNDDGSDIRFSLADGTHLFYEMERWDNSGQEAEFWVLLDTVFGYNSSSNVYNRLGDSTVIKMWWSNSSAVDSTNAGAVFSTGNGFEAVWHFADLTDATANANDLTAVSDPASSSDAVIGTSYHFDNDDYAYKQNSTGAPAYTPTGKSTLSCWVKGNTTYGVMYSASNSGDAVPFLGMRFNGGTSFQKIWRADGGSSQPQSDASATALDNTWHYVTAVYDSTAGISARDSFYVDGTFDKYVANGTERGTTTLNTVAVGTFYRPGQTNQNYLQGYLDEFRVSSAPRSADWIKLCYQNQQSSQTLVDFGPSCPGVIFEDDFNRADNETLYRGWDETEDATEQVEVASNALLFTANNGNYDPVVYNTFEEQSSGTFEWEFNMNFARGSKTMYELHMQLGNSGSWAAPGTSTEQGVGVYLLWHPGGCTDGHECLEYVTNNGADTTAIRSTAVSGDTDIKVTVHMNSNTYDVDVGNDGSNEATGLAFDNDVDINAIRFFGDDLATSNMTAEQLDDIVITKVATSGGGTTENYSADWTNDITLYLNTTRSGANVLENVIDFPVLVRLDAGNFPFAQAKSDGTDLRFAKSNGDHLYYEIERWDNAASRAEIWVKVDTVYGNNKSQSITMHWGKASAPDSAKPGLVFDTANGFEGVWHLSEAPTGGATSLDRTYNANHGTGTNTEGTDTAEAVIGKGIDFDGSNEYIKVPDDASLDNTSDQMTAMAWIKSDAIPTGSSRDIIMSKMGKAGTVDFNWFYGFDASDAPDGHLRAALRSGATNNGHNDSMHLNADVWYHTGIVYNGSKLKFYVNGRTYHEVSRSGNMQDIDSALCIGDYSSEGRAFDGIIDEPRYSSTARDSNWFKLCYENQKPAQTLVEIEQYESDWSSYRTLHLNTNASTGAGAESDAYSFPVLVRLTSSNWPSGAAGDGDDIRFSSSDGTHLCYEIERWSNGSNAEIWVSVDTVFGNANGTHTSDTTEIRMYWGNGNAVGRSDGSGVFRPDFGYQGVWHLDEETAGTGNTDL
ncbi:MAG: DUF2341 domain-containing protein, partial [Chitinivibrionales bacterium]|nr:DUF2341 domain-containing protein [Chitinivibrionales bacterium]